MGPTWVLSAPDGPHVGPMNLAITDVVAYSVAWIDVSQNVSYNKNIMNLQFKEFTAAWWTMCQLYQTETPCNLHTSACNRHDKWYTRHTVGLVGFALVYILRGYITDSEGNHTTAHVPVKYPLNIWLIQNQTDNKTTSKQNKIVCICHGLYFM